jgi:hypothetical protein
MYVTMPNQASITGDEDRSELRVQLICWRRMQEVGTCFLEKYQSSNGGVDSSDSNLELA